MSTKSRLEVLTRRLQSRVDRNGEAMPGYKQNVAAIRAEIAQLEENMEAASGK